MKRNNSWMSAIMLCGMSTPLCAVDMQSQYPPAIYVDFEESMGKHPIQFGLIHPDDYDWYTYFKQQYQRYNFNQITSDVTARIPKIIHQIWLGSPVPDEYKPWMQSWKQFHPDWMYLLWTDKEACKFDMVNRDLFEQARNYGQKSDVLRYELLHQFGGVYADTDFRCLKPFDVLHHCYDFYIGILNGGASEVAIGLIGSVPQHPILQCVIQSMHDVKSDNPEAILETTGNYHFLRHFMAVAPQCIDSRIIALPCSYFYPSPNWQRFGTTQEQDAWIKPESFAIHYWTCSWQKPEAEVK
ncbi:MAG: glycosyltransferase [Candidatus Babeliales bacterium]